jgi:hypothetical protein
MLDGRVPNLIPDVRADDRTASLPMRRSGNVRAFATVPLTFADGRVYGTLSAASHDVKSFAFQDYSATRRSVKALSTSLKRVTLHL